MLARTWKEHAHVFNSAKNLTVTWCKFCKTALGLEFVHIQRILMDKDILFSLWSKYTSTIWVQSVNWKYSNVQIHVLHVLPWLQCIPYLLNDKDETAGHTASAPPRVFTKTLPSCSELPAWANTVAMRLLKQLNYKLDNTNPGTLEVVGYLGDTIFLTVFVARHLCIVAGGVASVVLLLATKTTEQRV